jgi:alkanesulfonate monooxygenase SsuD/methylene tetrahydromethanopterin reductase-like flavin-dependent oxidoreductase (luciferase family)
MAALSIAIWGAGGLTWTLWKRLMVEIEQLGFAGLYFIDALPHALQVYSDSLETMVALTYLADHTERVQIGTVVALMAVRDPVTLVRQAVALDELSGGRFILGLGAGGQAREHRMFGYDFGDLPTRMARLEEGLEVITRLLREAEPVTFSGRFYQLEEAMVLPHPQRVGSPPILVGGSGPKRTLPLVARYADIWNPQLLTPDEYRERSALLDNLLRAAGRPLNSVKRTVSVRVACGRNPAELEQRASWLRRQVPFFASLPFETLAEMLRAQFGALVGSPEMIVEHMRALIAAGTEEIILEWSALDDIAGLQLIAEEILPNIEMLTT